MESRNHIKTGRNRKAKRVGKLKKMIMKKFLLSLLLFTICAAGFCTKRTITSSGFTFSPATITISVGDSVNFNIESIHNAVEVSQATWNNNGTTPLPGFSVPFGGGLVLPAKLTLGTHYYVCTPHASSGMKGTIIVQNTTNSSDVQWQTNLSVYPNPSNGKIHCIINNLPLAKECNMKICNLQGETVYETGVISTTSDIDISNLTAGIYIMRVCTGQTILTRKISIR